MKTSGIHRTQLIKVVVLRLRYEVHDTRNVEFDALHGRDTGWDGGIGRRPGRIY